MIRPINKIGQMKTYIKSMYDKKVCVRVSLGRNKYKTFEGTLSGVYPALFTISPDDKKFLGKTTYSYSELLCGTVKVKEKKQ